MSDKMTTFQKWQNKEITDIECIRELNKDNIELVEVINKMCSMSKKESISCDEYNCKNCFVFETLNNIKTGENQCPETEQKN